VLQQISCEYCFTQCPLARIASYSPPVSCRKLRCPHSEPGFFIRTHAPLANFDAIRRNEAAGVAGRRRDTMRSASSSSSTHHHQHQHCTTVRSAVPPATKPSKLQKIHTQCFFTQHLSHDHSQPTHPSKPRTSVPSPNCIDVST